MQDSRAERVLRLAVYGLPVLVAVAVRAGLPSYFEFESQEDTLRAMTLVERGEVPLYGIGHVRFLAAALGPLVYYVKAIPHLFSPHPMAEIVFLVLLHLGALVASTAFAAHLFEELLRSGALPAPWKRPRAAALAAAGVVGILLALSVYSNSLTSHAHPAYFAGAFAPPLLYGFHRWLHGGGRAGLVLAGTSLGIMTQFYQLALFAPLLLLFMWIPVRRLPDRKALAAFLAPLFICYLPYLLSEMLTGFSNSAGFFRFEPGPQDDRSLGQGTTAANALYFLASVASHYLLPERVGGLLVGLAVVGLGAGLRSLTRSRGFYSVVALALVYVVLPMVVLSTPRFALSLPVGALLAALGGLAVTAWLRRLWQTAAPVPRMAGTIAAAAAAVMVMVAFPYKDPVAGPRLHVPYPTRMVDTFPVGGMPTLPESEEVLAHLRRTAGVDVSNLADRVASPVVASGFYGHLYLLRVLEGEIPPGPAPSAPLFVVDDRFPYEVLDGTAEAVGSFTVHQTRSVLDGPRVALACDDPWCTENQPAGPLPRLALRFFWGCSEFRELDARLSVPPEECEAMLGAPRHDRRYHSGVRWAEPPPDCADCRAVLFLAADPECATEVLLDGVPVEPIWVHGMKRDYGFLEAPGDPPPASLRRLDIHLRNCVPHTFQAAPFVGRRKPTGILP